MLEKKNDYHKVEISNHFKSHPENFNKMLSISNVTCLYQVQPLAFQ